MKGLLCHDSSSSSSGGGVGGGGSGGGGGCCSGGRYGCACQILNCSFICGCFPFPGTETSKVFHFHTLYVRLCYRLK